MITKRKVKKFVDKFGQYLLDGIAEYKFESDVNDNKKYEGAAMAFDEIFQIFGRHELRVHAGGNGLQVVCQHERSVERADGEISAGRTRNHGATERQERYHFG